jgi:hypothetical protein
MIELFFRDCLDGFVSARHVVGIGFQEHPCDALVVETTNGRKVELISFDLWTLDEVMTELRRQGKHYPQPLARFVSKKQKAAAA